MRLMFVCWPFEDQGSGLVIQGYCKAAEALGHQVAVYGRSNPKIPLNYSLDLETADAVVFIFEWTTQLWSGDALDVLRLATKVPRRRRVILDGDGNYNEIDQIDGDFNHRGTAERDRWIEICDSLSDKICQPTLHPQRPNIRSFLFYSYNPAWERPLGAYPKEFSMIYLGTASSVGGQCRGSSAPSSRSARSSVGSGLSATAGAHFLHGQSRCISRMRTTAM